MQGPTGSSGVQRCENIGQSSGRRRPQITSPQRQAVGFAAGAVAILSALGCTHLSFGSESGELEGLETLAECLLNPLTMEAVKKRMAAEPNLSFAAARQLVLKEKVG